MFISTIRRTLIVLQLTVLIPPSASAYSVLTHEALVDSTWDATFKPLLLRRFPHSTAEQLRGAHAYAYGGSIIQDMGYYPFGSKFFSDLVHYVRSGDFVIRLLSDAKDINEFAFALGALNHYGADSTGHPEAVNVAEPILYPKIRRKYGNVVTYEDNPGAHLKTEFGFDVVEVAKGNYAPQAYHDFIGFQVSKPLLERAFEDTYSVPLDSVFKDLDLALGTYRHVVSSLIPEMTKAAWAAKKDDIQKAQPGMTERKFIYRISREDYEKEWDNKYEKPGPGAHILAFMFKVLPKVGPLKVLGFKTPNAECEKIFIRSFADTVARVRSYDSEVREHDLHLANVNFDTGKPVRQGEYHMADDAYGKLLGTYADKQIRPSEPMRANILAFYRDPAQITDPKALTELNALRQTSVAHRTAR
jgi:hypothetical protein